MSRLGRLAGGAVRPPGRSRRGALRPRPAPRRSAPRTTRPPRPRLERLPRPLAGRARRGSGSRGPRPLRRVGDRQPSRHRDAARAPGPRGRALPSGRAAERPRLLDRVCRQPRSADRVQRSRGGDPPRRPRPRVAARRRPHGARRPMPPSPTTTPRPSTASWPPGRTGRVVVAVESIYSVLGDAAPLRDLVEVCHRHGALLVVDEAHGIGVAGHGRGLVHELGLVGARDLVVTVTLSKALGSQGGAVLGSTAVRHHLVNTARSFIFDTGLAPAVGRRRVHGRGHRRGRRRRSPQQCVPTPAPSRRSAGSSRRPARCSRCPCRRPTAPSPRRSTCAPRASSWAASGRPACPTACRGSGSRRAPTSTVRTSSRPPRLVARAAALHGAPSRPDTVEGPRAGDAPSPVRGLPSVAAVEGPQGPVPPSPLGAASPRGDDE